ncbi:MAG TPA: TolC family protein [Chitinophagaceae bacterium]|nr:TolC family protein [Chitinophagaceae bacterium]
MNRTFFLSILFCIQWISLLSIAQTASSGKKLTLPEAIQTAITNNVQVRQSEVQVQISEVNWQQSKKNLLPNLNGIVNHGINQGRSIDPFTNSYANQQINYAEYALGSSVVLFNGSRLKNIKQQTALAYDAAKMELEGTKDDITIRAILAYLQILNNEDLLVLAKSTSEVTRQQVSRLEILNKEGAVSPPLLHDLKGQLMSDELTILNRQNAVASSKLALTQLMNIPYDMNIIVERITSEDEITTYVQNAEEVYLKAAMGMAVIKAAALRRKSAEASLKAVRGELFPVVSLNGNLNSNFSSAARKDILLGSTFMPSSDYVIVNGSQIPVVTKQNNFFTERINYNNQIKNNIFSNINLGLRFPIFNASLTRGRINLARLEIKNSELLEETNKIALRQQVEEAYLNMTNAFERHKVSQQQLAAYMESFHAAEVRFNAGVGTSVDYILAKNNVDRANNNLILAKYEFLLRKKILDFYSGNPVQ